MPNIISKRLNNKMENSNERLLTEQCACDLTSDFPCSDMEVQEKEPTILQLSYNKSVFVCILYKQIKLKSISNVLSPRL